MHHKRRHFVKNRKKVIFKGPFKIHKRNIKEKSNYHEFIVKSKHDDSGLDENPKGEGKFGLEATNPIPIYGLDNLSNYMDKLHVKTVREDNKTVYESIDFMRTSASDQTPIGSERPAGVLVASSTQSPNIDGIIDVYNVYSTAGKKLAKLYVNTYSLKTSNKVPAGFVHEDEAKDDWDSFDWKFE